MKKLIIPSTTLMIFLIAFFIGFRIADVDKTVPVAISGTAEDLPVSPLNFSRATAPSPAPTQSAAQVLTLSAVGDCTLGTDITLGMGGTFLEKQAEEGNDYFFSNVVDIFENSDITIANLEGVFTNYKKRADKKYTFSAPPSFANILTQGSINLVNLANNHTQDFGEQGYKDTLKALEEEGVKYIDNDKTEIMDINGAKIGFCGFKGFDNSAAAKKNIKTVIDKLKQDGAQIVVVSFHWGIEGQYSPNVVQRNLGRYVIDNGADLVLGHHPHVLQPIEEYKGRYIVYSLGNFCFGGNRNPSDKDTIIFQQTITVSENNYVRLGEYKVIPCLLSSVTNKNDYRPTPAQGDDIKRILNKVSLK